VCFVRTRAARNRTALRKLVLDAHKKDGNVIVIDNNVTMRNETMTSGALAGQGDME